MLKSVQKVKLISDSQVEREIKRFSDFVADPSIAKFKLRSSNCEVLIAKFTDPL